MSSSSESDPDDVLSVMDDNESEKTSTAVNSTVVVSMMTIEEKVRSVTTLASCDRMRSVTHQKEFPTSVQDVIVKPDFITDRNKLVDLSFFSLHKLTILGVLFNFLKILFF